MNAVLLPCPFCGRAVEDDLIDTLYPTGGWRSVHGRKDYASPMTGNLDGRVWTMHCKRCNGGCGAEINGDSRDEAIAAWNTRAPLRIDVGAISDHLHTLAKYLRGDIADPWPPAPAQPSAKVLRKRKAIGVRP